MQSIDERDKKGLNSNIHFAVDAHRIPLKIIVTSGTTHHQLHTSIAVDEGLDADFLLADQGYDSNRIVEQAGSQGMIAVIPLKKNRRNAGIMTEKFIRQYIKLKTRFCSLNNGEEYQLAMKKCGLIFCCCSDPLYRLMGENLTTHYVVLGYEILIKEDVFNLPKKQRAKHRWNRIR